MSIAEIDALLNKQSGLKGLCGVNDFRELERLRSDGDEAAQLALDVYVHRLRHYLGAYAAILGRLDLVVFTAGVGENSARLRAAVAGRSAGAGHRRGHRAQRRRRRRRPGSSRPTGRR